MQGLPAAVLACTPRNKPPSESSGVARVANAPHAWGAGNELLTPRGVGPPLEGGLPAAATENFRSVRSFARFCSHHPQVRRGASPRWRRRGL